MWGRVRSQCVPNAENVVTGEFSVSYIGVGIKGGAGVAMAPHFPAIIVYQSLYSFCLLCGCG